MHIEYDGEADALYVYAREILDGAVSRQLRLQAGVYVDVDKENRILGVEFLSLKLFSRYLIEHGGLELPERYAGPESLIPA
jgi:uncharacterized protein YuzE